MTASLDNPDRLIEEAHLLHDDVEKVRTIDGQRWRTLWVVKTRGGQRHYMTWDYRLKREAVAGVADTPPMLRHPTYVTETRGDDVVAYMVDVFGSRPAKAG